MRRVVVTGMGVVSSIGNNTQEVLASLVRHLPAVLGRRRRIRSGRLVADAEILRWLYPRARWDARQP